MDWLSFIIAVLQVLAWPAVVILLALKFGKALTGVLDRIKKLKYGDGEAELTIPQLEPPKEPAPKQLPSAERKALPPGEKATSEPTSAEAATNGPANSPEATLPTAETQAAERALLDFAPAGAVVTAWARLETVLEFSVARLNLRTPTSFSALVRELRKHGILDDQVFNALQVLRNARNDVVHKGAIPTTASAEAFVAAVDVAIKRVEQATRQARLRQLLAELRAADVRDVRVGPAKAIGVRATPEPTLAMANTVTGRFVAESVDVRMLVSRDDMLLLLDSGAPYFDPLESSDKFVAALRTRLEQMPDKATLTVVFSEKQLVEAMGSAGYWLPAVRRAVQEYLHDRPAVERVTIEMPEVGPSFTIERAKASPPVEQPA